jgi:hypothetical protein
MASKEKGVVCARPKCLVNRKSRYVRKQSSDCRFISSMWCSASGIDPGLRGIKSQYFIEKFADHWYGSSSVTSWLYIEMVDSLCCR